MPLPEPKPLIKTYVLIGDDQLGCDELYSKRKDVVILRASDCLSIADTLAKVQTPANIIVQCHGARNGTFTWLKGEAQPSYADLFKALPRTGILSVTFGSCFGATAKEAEMMKYAPPGTLVQSLTGAKTVGWTHHTKKFAVETEGLTEPIDLILKAFDNFSPTTFKSATERENREKGFYEKYRAKKLEIDTQVAEEQMRFYQLQERGDSIVNSSDPAAKKQFHLNANQFQLTASQMRIQLLSVQLAAYEPYDSNPDNALPNSIAIGGNPARTIDLDVETARLAKTKTPLDGAAMNRAIARVQARFDTIKAYTPDNHPDWYLSKEYDSGKGPAAEKELDAAVADMAAMLQRGYTPKTTEERRIAYAITTAYLHESGEMQRRVEGQAHYISPYVTLDAFGREITMQSIHADHAYKIFKQPRIDRYYPSPKPIHIDDQKPSRITMVEQAYLDSVAARLENDPKLNQIITELYEVFLQSVGRDRFDEKGALDKQLTAKGINTKTWTR